MYRSAPRHSVIFDTGRYNAASHSSYDTRAERTSRLMRIIPTVKSTQYPHLPCVDTRAMLIALRWKYEANRVGIYHWIHDKDIDFETGRVTRNNSARIGASRVMQEAYVVNYAHVPAERVNLLAAQPIGPKIISRFYRELFAGANPLLVHQDIMLAMSIIPTTQNPRPANCDVES